MQVSFDVYCKSLINLYRYHSCGLDCVGFLTHMITSKSPKEKKNPFHREGSQLQRMQWKDEAWNEYN